MVNNFSQSNGDMPFSVDIDNYGDADVVAFGTTAMHKMGKVKATIKELSKASGYLDSYLAKELTNSLGVNSWWIKNGADCEILKTSGQGWRKGKIKFEITVKFYPDEPEIEELPTSNKQEVNQVESPLDDIRRAMDIN